MTASDNSRPDWKPAVRSTALVFACQFVVAVGLAIMFRVGETIDSAGISDAQEVLIIGAFVGLLTCQAFGLSAWMTLGTAPWPPRLIGVLLSYGACLALTQLVSAESWRFVLLSGGAMLLLQLPFWPLRAFLGVRVSEVDPTDQSVDSGGRFTMWQLLVFTTIAAAPLAVFRTVEASLMLQIFGVIAVAGGIAIPAFLSPLTATPRRLVLIVVCVAPVYSWMVAATLVELRWTYIAALYWSQIVLSAGVFCATVLLPTITTSLLLRLIGFRLRVGHEASAEVMPQTKGGHGTRLVRLS